MQRVLITGGGSGIGRATARTFAGRGARVLVVGRTKHALAETAVDRRLSDLAAVRDRLAANVRRKEAELAELAGLGGVGNSGAQ